MTLDDVISCKLLDAMRQELGLQHVEDGLETVHLRHPPSWPDLTLHALELTDAGTLEGARGLEINKYKD